MAGEFGYKAQDLKWDWRSRRLIEVPPIRFLRIGTAGEISVDSTTLPLFVTSYEKILRESTERYLRPSPRRPLIDWPL